MMYRILPPYSRGFYSHTQGHRPHDWLSTALLHYLLKGHRSTDEIDFRLTPEYLLRTQDSGAEYQLEGQT